jgi:hypothetical protein
MYMSNHPTKPHREQSDQRAELNERCGLMPNVDSDGASKPLGTAGDRGDTAVEQEEIYRGGNCTSV